jgi:hypothetical protein
MINFNVSAITEQAIEALKIVYEEKNGSGSFDVLVRRKIDGFLNKEIQKLKLPEKEEDCSENEWVLNQFRIAYELTKP